MQSGTCGKNLAWELDDNGTLTISGEGVMEDSGWIFGKTPWRKYDKFIEKIVIERGVKSVGEASQFPSASKRLAHLLLRNATVLRT